MLSSPRSRVLSLALGVAALIALAVFFGRGFGTPSLPAPDSPKYEAMVSAFYRGVLSMQTGEDETARNDLLKATTLVPGEPAAWADLALFQLRKNDLAAAQKSLDEAVRLSPPNAQIEALAGLLAFRQGKDDVFVAHLTRAVELAPDDLRARYALTQALQRPGQSEEKAKSQLQALAKALPLNLFVQKELGLIAVRSGDAALLRAAVGKLASQRASWPAEAQEVFARLQSAASGTDVGAALAPLSQLWNVLKGLPQYRKDVEEIGGNSEPDKLGVPLERFIVLPPPAPTPAPPDTTLTFGAQPVPGAGGGWTLARTLTPVPEVPPVAAQSYITQSESEQAAHTYGLSASQEGPVWTLLANGRTVRLSPPTGVPVSLPFPGGPSATPPTPDGVLLLDWNNDFRPDLLLSGAGGVRFVEQTRAGGFADVTAKTGLPPSIVNGPATGAWAFDIESDGDLDIVLGTPSGPPVVLRNNGDGRWAVLHPFAKVAGLRGFASADVTADGNPDAALLDGAGRLTIFKNERSGRFSPLPALPASGPLIALAPADADSDGVVDVTTLGADGVVRRVSVRDDAKQPWKTAELARATLPLKPGARLIWADLDNNGGVDFLVTGPEGSEAWLGGTDGKFLPLAGPVGARSVAAAEPFTSERLDLIGVDASGQALRLTNKGAKTYRREVVRFRSQGRGNNRINSFGVGGEMEVRAGLLYQKFPVLGPTVRFGLGENAQPDCIRINWPNGVFQSECKGLPANNVFAAIQRLTGSCPWLFAWDGKGMKYVTDCIWRSPLGLRINAQATAGIGPTQDWVKLRGDQLQPRDGFYDLRITADLWETHFFDHLGLMTVDHPVGTEIFVDERFALPPPPLKAYATTAPRSFARATDDKGADVAETVRARDRRYLDTFGRGQYQGVTRDHWVELTLPTDAPRIGPLWLVANGWIHPTDSSINVALSQNRRAAPPTGLSVETPDGRGGWRIVRRDQGFPEGKIKTVLMDLTHLWKPGETRRLRLRTNLEIYWDSLGWAAGLPQTPLKTQRLALAGADLRYRGFSATHQADESSPELPDYETVAVTHPIWRDLEGFYTRFGDVRPLLQAIDDRYVIMNAGDELALRFPAAPAPPPGWTRDFVLVGDGWVKDGNFNTAYATTVLPLPQHVLKNYDAPLTSLEDDPAFRAHRADWQTFHTRWVSPASVGQALRPHRDGRR